MTKKSLTATWDECALSLLLRFDFDLAPRVRALQAEHPTVRADYVLALYPFSGSGVLQGLTRTFQGTLVPTANTHLIHPNLAYPHIYRQRVAALDALYALEGFIGNLSALVPGSQWKRQHLGLGNDLTQAVGHLNITNARVVSYGSLLYRLCGVTEERGFADSSLLPQLNYQHGFQTLNRALIKL